MVNTMQMRRLLSGVSAVLLAVAVVGCEGTKNYTVVDGTMLGTTLHAVADAGDASAAELYAAAMAVDAEAKASMSIFDSTSLLSRLNSNQTDSVDRHIAFNLRLADSIGRLSGGCYDVTVKPLVEVLGFAGKERAEKPNIDSILEFVGFGKVRIEDGRLVKDDPRIQLDFNSIAKGYTVDLLAGEMERRGAENYIVDIGGEVRCRGVNREGNPWRIGIETPFDGNMSDGDFLQRRVAITDGALATSGNYRRFYYDADGNKVAHTIDPKSGRSVLSSLLSATVVAATCAEADALCTMFMAMGADAAMAFVAEHPEMRCYFILAGEGDGYEEFVSPAMQPLMMQ